MRGEGHLPGWSPRRARSEVPDVPGRGVFTTAACALGDDSQKPTSVDVKTEPICRTTGAVDFADSSAHHTQAKTVTSAHDMITPQIELAC